MITKFIVELDRPAGVSIAECRSYIRDAVETWRGQLRPPGGNDENDPGDPMWSLNPKSVKLTLVKKQKN